MLAILSFLLDGYQRCLSGGSIVTGNHFFAPLRTLLGAWCALLGRNSVTGDDSVEEKRGQHRWKKPARLSDRPTSDALTRSLAFGM